MNDINKPQSGFDCVKDHADAWRVIRWIQDRNRKPANLAFTDGLERQIAYAVEKLLWDKDHPF